MPGDNNPNNSVGGGWHLTHNLIKQIYSYSAHSGKKFYSTKRNPNIRCKDNLLVYESAVKADGISNQIDTGIIFSDMLIYLKNKPKNRNDNSYNTHSTLPSSNSNIDENEDEKEYNDDDNDIPGVCNNLKVIDLPKQNKNKKTKRRKDMKKTHTVDYG